MIFGAVIFQLLKNKYIVDPDGNQLGLAPKKIEKPVKTVKSNADDSSHSRSVMSVIGIVLLTLLFSVNWQFNNVSELFSGADWIGSLIYATTIVMPIVIILDKSLTTPEKKRIAVIYILAFFVIFFWSAYEQAGASLTFFADEQTDRHIGSWEMPTAYFQSFKPTMIVIFAPIFAAFWAFLGRHKLEPSSPCKQAIGLLLLALGYLYISFGVKDLEPGVKVSMMWLIGLFLFFIMGELCLSPIGLSLVYRLSPARFSSLIMGVWYLSSSAANKFAGLLSSFYPENGVAKSFLGYQVANLHDFFMLFVFMSGASALILFFLAPKLKKMMDE